MPPQPPPVFIRGNDCSAIRFNPATIDHRGVGTWDFGECPLLAQSGQSDRIGDADPSGIVSTYQPGGTTLTSSNPFFQSLGTNGRTCFTCHQLQTGWTVSAQSVQARFNSSLGTDPIFRLVDGATCPTADVSSLQNKLQAYSLLLSKGLIRIGLPVPANAEFQVSTS
jgi:cytochrome c peroxidase